MSIFQLIILKISGLAIVFAVFFIIRAVLAPTKSFSDFFVGDLGSFSLARVQMVLWVYVIVSFQITVLVIISSFGIDKIYLFDIVLPEEILWLIGLSSTGYITVKGITNNKIINNAQGPVKMRNWADLILGENGLDFSKFQFLIWTLIAVYVYALHCNLYLNKLIYANDKTLNAILLDTSHNPSVSWSFIILMGLSQGTYIGKKLIPVHKADEFKSEKSVELNEQLSSIEIDIESKKLLISSNSITEIGKMQSAALRKEVISLEADRDRLQAEINRI